MLTLDEALNGNVVPSVRFVLSEASSLNTSSASSNTGADKIIQFNNNLVGAYNSLSNIQTVGGSAMITYVQAQYNNGSLDVNTAWTNLLTSLLDTVLWMNGAVTGVFLYVPNNTTKVIEPASFTPAQTAGFRTQLVNLIGACNAMLP